ncbi:MULTISPECIES: hypothetical protein [Photorhabdus]|uniref:Uncharacterized protein n=1 Tax=Photorhabdus kayaii TaxID=230088 RepID=A0ABX0BA69_9GAMM|nr:MULTISPECIES: hypothetical protein [Photorhabdus]MCT8354731.1 hypothetical protein [Photorhabdus kayaii]NDL14583.1 hypothetical protein [Photorhabdus kayaii]NDL28031.1 hypothetical protein [Photorhabdus kayaii]RAX05553.1 hypothetical protein CKY10_23540 [Photorhabdus sp. HUG-39]
MNRITFIILVISYISFNLFLIISIAIYKINQKKMDKIIELYMEKGFCLSTAAYMGHSMGIHGQIHPAVFFYKLLTGKRIRINRPNSKYMPQESYDFIQNLPSNLTHWIKIYFITINISLVSFSISMAICLFQKYA